ncbi:MAG: nucleotidyltransferase domain-containing protein [Alphaproteobacteria bacterium]|nr:nucleotidyltransferase domain-containing protein [Alphaproteobacteria bacterium]
MVIATVPEALLGPVVAYFDPVKVILFGSAARGEARPDSDFDLLVVLDDDSPADKMNWRALDEARRSYKGAADLLACRHSIYERKSQVPGTFAHAVALEGVVVYERS